MSKEEVLNDTSRFQRACDKYIHHDAVIYCASSLMYELREVAENLEDYDTYLTLVGGRPDNEEAARYFIMEDADLEQLEEMAEEVGYWSDVFDDAKGSIEGLKIPFYVSRGDAGVKYWVATAEEALERAKSPNFGHLEFDADIDDEATTSDWCEHNEGLEQRIRDAVWELHTEEAEYAAVVSEYDLEPDYREVYEHWIVSRYFGEQLASHGEIVEEYLGLNIWARTTTGQSISMDGVIERLVRELDEGHWIFQEA